MEKLKVGDRVVNISHIYSSKEYSFSNVVRLTTTLAILENGSKIKNEPYKSFREGIYFNEIGKHDAWSHRSTAWELSTPEIEKEAKEYYNKRKMLYWFSSKKFTDDEKIKVFELFHPKDVSNE